MTIVRFALALALGSLAPGLVRAEAPKIDNILPIGVQRGVATDLVISGNNLAGHPSLVAPFGFAGDVAANSDGGNFRLKITVDPATPVGVYVIRVRADDGLSNPFLLAIGQIPQVAEKEDNSQFNTAQPIPAPVVVEGMCAGTDVDFFRFAGKKGQRIIVDAQCSRVGSGVDPQIRLTTVGRKFVESADDSLGLMTDARLSAVLPEDGDYVVELSDSKYQGAGRPYYRLEIGAVPVATEVYPFGGRRGETVGFELRGGTLDGEKIFAATLPTEVMLDNSRVKPLSEGLLEVELPTAIDLGETPEIREASDPAAGPVRGAAPVVFNGRINPPGDEDRFSVPVTSGQSLRIRVDASEFGSALDGTLRVLGPAGNVLANAEDSTVPAGIPKGMKKPQGIVTPDPSLDFTVPAGVNEVTLALRDLIGRGGIGFPYRISVVPITPGFRLAVNEAQISLPPNGTAAVSLTLLRQGFDGPIELTIQDPPPGVSVRGMTVPPGANAGVITLSATRDFILPPSVLKIVGKATGPAGPIVEVASKLLIFAQQGNLPTNTINQNGLPAASALVRPVAIDTPATPVEIVHGVGGSIPIKCLRDPNVDDSLALSPLTPPAGIGVSGSIAEKATDGSASVTAAVESPLGRSVLVVIAKGKLAGKEMTLVAPAVAIEVVRPASVELAAPALEIKAGATIEAKGKLTRRGAFKEPVTLTLANLPAGLKSDPVTLAPDASDFTFKLVADAAAAPADAKPQVNIGFKIGGKDYPTPPVPLAIKVVK